MRLGVPLSSTPASNEVTLRDGSATAVTLPLPSLASLETEVSDSGTLFQNYRWSPTPFSPMPRVVSSLMLRACWSLTFP